MMTRRVLLAGGATGLVALASSGGWVKPSSAAGTFDVTHTEAEWHKLLTPDQFAVLRQEATERPFTSPLLHEERHGEFACAGCDLDLFDSSTKFDSHTGWPSFWQAREGGIATVRDASFAMVRTAVQCSRCGGHIGHVFNDGPKPTGLRYCMNGVAMTFKPAAA